MPNLKFHCNITKKLLIFFIVRFTNKLYTSTKWQYSADRNIIYEYQIIRILFFRSAIGEINTILIYLRPQLNIITTN